MATLESGNDWIIKKIGQGINKLSIIASSWLNYISCCGICCGTQCGIELAHPFLCHCRRTHSCCAGHCTLHSACQFGGSEVPSLCSSSFQHNPPRHTFLSGGTPDSDVCAKELSSACLAVHRSYTIYSVAFVHFWLSLPEHRNAPSFPPLIQTHLSNPSNAKDVLPSVIALILLVGKRHVSFPQ